MAAGCSPQLLVGAHGEVPLLPYPEVVDDYRPRKNPVAVLAVRRLRLLLLLGARHVFLTDARRVPVLQGRPYPGGHGLSEAPRAQDHMLTKMYNPILQGLLN